jgi:hypothetical protein
VDDRGAFVEQQPSIDRQIIVGAKLVTAHMYSGRELFASVSAGRINATMVTYQSATVLGQSTTDSHTTTQKLPDAFDILSKLLDGVAGPSLQDGVQAVWVLSELF